MDRTMEIKLSKNKSKKSTNVNNSLAVELKGSKRLLPIGALDTTVNEIELYNNERKTSTTIRLTCSINPICSNVLFNNITEVVINEGSDKCKCLNYGGLESSYFNSVEGKSNKTIFNGNVYEAIRDTQLSNEALGFDYHCGIDIFNNHILRSNTFKTVCYPTSKTDKFNTIEDWMRNEDGTIISGFTDAYSGTSKGDIPLHVYLADEVSTYKDCVSDKLLDENGWLGFTNVGKFPTYDKKGAQYDFYKVINNRKPCDFVDMAPERDLFYFTPKFNPSRKRVEKNWNYCITYPSSSTTEGFSFIRKNTNSLKVCVFDDNSRNMNGTSGLKLYSVSMHGLSVGDYVNVYRGDNVMLRNAEVYDVEDEFSFSVYNNGVKVSDNWTEITTSELQAKSFTRNGTIYTVSQDGLYAFANDVKYPIVPSGNTVCLDDTSSSENEISYKRVVEGGEVEYYVRIFSRLPNWKFADEKPSEYNMYKDEQALIKKYNVIDYEFENHINKLAFSKNIYNDDVAEIVFTDDIDVADLKDNLGRPITDIYLTIVKNNSGFKEWYNSGNTSSDTVEYSHCFGKNSCGFRLSRYSLYNNDYINIIALSNNLDGSKYRGHNIDILNGDRSDNGVDDSEIQYGKIGTYEGDRNFYGDLCCYSDILLDEYSIQTMEFRFNTAQRELNESSPNYSKFSSIYYDEITSDDYDSGFKFSVEKKEITDACRRNEGYCYIPHYKIPFRTFSNTISTEKPTYYTIKEFNQSTKELYTMEKTYFEIGDIFLLKYDNNITVRYLKCEVTSVEDLRRFKFKMLDSTEDLSKLTDGSFKIVKATEDTPDYAEMSTEGSCYYMWREIIENGYDKNTDVESYPFVNGSFYVNKSINFFLKRQDPNGYGGLWSKTYPYDMDSNLLTFEEEDNYIEEEDITC
jgi:hypothetical protein